MTIVKFLEQRLFSETKKFSEAESFLMIRYRIDKLSRSTDASERVSSAGSGGQSISQQTGIGLVQIPADQVRRLAASDLSGVDVSPFLFCLSTPSAFRGQVVE